MNSPIEQNLIPLTVEEFFAIYGEENERYELIDGIPYMMAAPGTVHQELSMFLSIEISGYLKGKKCKLFVAPYDVFLKESPTDESGKPKKNKRVKGTVVQPDLMVICDKEKIKHNGCHGAPDFIIEIASLSTREMDKGYKMRKYASTGVKEYWLVDPAEEKISVYKFKQKGKKAEVADFTFKDKVKSHVLEGLEIDFSQAGFDFDEFHEFGIEAYKNKRRYKKL